MFFFCNSYTTRHINRSFPSAVEWVAQPEKCWNIFDMHKSGALIRTYHCSFRFRFEVLETKLARNSYQLSAMADDVWLGAGAPLSNPFINCDCWSALDTRHALVNLIFQLFPSCGSRTRPNCCWNVPQHIVALCNVPHTLTITNPWESMAPLTPSRQRFGL